MTCESSELVNLWGGWETFFQRVLAACAMRHLVFVTDCNFMMTGSLVCEALGHSSGHLYFSTPTNLVFHSLVLGSLPGTRACVKAQQQRPKNQGEMSIPHV